MHSESIEIHKEGAALLSKFHEEAKLQSEEHAKGVEGTIAFLAKHSAMLE